MVAWKALLWPVLLVGAGFAWVLVIGVSAQILPTVNMFIESGMMSNQTVGVLNSNLNILYLVPGVGLVLIGVGLLADVILGGGR